MVDFLRRRVAVRALRAHGRRDRGGATHPHRRAERGRHVNGDPRVKAYAKLLVETCIDVQPGWQVILRAGVLARPLIEEISALLGRKGAYVLTRVSASGVGTNVEWAAQAPPDVLSKPAPLEAHTWENA